MKKILLMLVLVISIAGCSSLPDGAKDVEKGTPVAVIELEDGREITLEFYPDKAPNTVNNFLTLAKDGFYDGVIFHRVIKDFMIQGGDPDGIGTGGPGYTIAGEMKNNGYLANDLEHKEGSIAMARSLSYDSAGSQFFINVKNNSFLNNEYAVFGQVISGYDIAVEISKVNTVSDKPVDEVKIKTITVYENGYEIKEVVKNEK